MAANSFDPNAPLHVSGRRELEPSPARKDPQDHLRNERNRQRMDALVARLTTLAQEQVSKKNWIEERWLNDLRQYHGRYDAATEATLNENKRSRLYANMTRPKTHAWEAKLSDMLFPTDGTKNWGIRPSPVPELQQAIDADQPEEPNITTIAPPRPAAGGQQGNGALPPPGPATQGPERLEIPTENEMRAAEAKKIMDEAKIKSDGMELEINDQLKQSKYDLAMRQVLHDACKLGTGVSKGPTLTNKTRRRWVEKDQDGQVVQVLADVEDPRPDNAEVDPWSFFPDMSAPRPREAGFFFERHLYNPKQVRDLAKQPGFNKDELRKLLLEGPHEGYPSYITTLREITGTGQDTLTDRFHIWEYHGPMDHEDLEAILESTGRGGEIEDFDPLEEINVIVWFSQNHLLKFGEQPMESGDPIYSVFSFERDETSMFGFGVPYLMRDSQKAVNGAWRMIMDNAALSAGPQVVVDQTIIEPADGSWVLTARKVWLRKTGSVPNAAKAFETFDIPNNQADLVAVINMARQFADDETSLPVIEQRGDEGQSHVTRTALGMAMLMNAVNVVFRRVVKNFDDEMTVPNITRMYDWNQQFSLKDNIKGDFEVDARGSSVLLVREMQAQNLMTMADRFTSHSVLGPMTRAAPLYRKLVEAHMLSPDDIVMTDAEIKAAQAELEKAGEQDPEILKLEMQLNIAQIEAEVRLQVANLERETKLMTLAETNNMTVAKLQVLLGVKQIETDSKERIFASEAAMEERLAAKGVTGGSGGFLSAGGGG